MFPRYTNGSGADLFSDEARLRISPLGHRRPFYTGVGCLRRRKRYTSSDGRTVRGAR